MFRGCARVTAKLRADAASLEKTARLLEDEVRSRASKCFLSRVRK